MNAPVRYAGFWLRFVASVIDSVLVTAIVGPLLWRVYGPEYFRGMIDMDPTRPMFAGPADFFLQLVLPAIAIVLFWMARQATPGKMVLGMKIADAKTFGPPTRMQDIVRYLGYYVSMLGLFLGFLWVALDARKQGWHDKIAGTVVIRTSP